MRFVILDPSRYDFGRHRVRFETKDPWGPTPSSRLGLADSNRLRAEVFDWPILGPMMKSHYMMEKMDQYLSDHGLTWADVDPLKMNQIFGSRSSTMMYVSKNILRMYR